MKDILNYEGVVIRPPNEANSLIFQITLGCSDNSCTFCPAFKEKKFRIKPFEKIKEEIEEASTYFPNTRRIFLADGDAIITPHKTLIKILKLLNKHFKKLNRIGIYGSSKSTSNKTRYELEEYKELKLGIIYLGIETGDDEVYKKINKWGTPKENIKECLKIKESGIKLNTTIILGLGGEKHFLNHAINTSKLLNVIRPDQIAALTLMIHKKTQIYDDARNKIFKIPSKLKLVEELYTIIDNLDDFNCLFFSNHASNYYPINARFPKDKKKVLSDLKNLISNKELQKLTPEFFRAL